MTRNDRSARASGGSAAVGPLDEGRAHFRARAWADAFAALSEADRAAPFTTAEDLELLGIAAALSAHEAEFIKVLERQYTLHVEAGATARAARVAFTLCMRLRGMGATGQAAGWLARAQRLVAAETSACVEEGFLLVPEVHRLLATGDIGGAEATARRALAIAEHFADADLLALTRHVLARALLRQGQTEAGLALLDEAMVAAKAGELSLMMTGIIYCAVIASCHQIYALDRAREWTTALADWCDAQPQLLGFTGICRVHRSEILQLGGAWREAIAEVERAGALCARGADPPVIAGVCYQQAELHRLHGEFALAETAYRAASQHGMEPQPGLALLRLAQGDLEAAAGATRRVLAGTSDPLQRARLLPAHVEIMLAAGDVDEAQRGAAELGATAELLHSDILGAIADHAAGAICLAVGDARQALPPLRRAFEVWHGIGAPYLAARLRVLLGRACQALGDVDGARLELGAAREVFERLGAQPDLSGLAALAAVASDSGAARPALRTPQAAGGRALSARELEVLRLVAKGKTNKEIAGDLTLSEKTVDRHVSNIFTKIHVSTRAAATAHAYQHGLV
jgi:DNA-binding CsgD family transcriptional regulator